jgi:uncharacterized membrane protein YeaQ/YmgE (transglycosylase-associated protein family)
MSNIIWIVVIGFVAGIIARFLSRGDNNPTGLAGALLRDSRIVARAGAFRRKIWDFLMWSMEC